MLKFLGPIRQPPSLVSLSVIVQFILTSLSEPETEHRVSAAGPLIRHRTYEGDHGDEEPSKRNAIDLTGPKLTRLQSNRCGKPHRSSEKAHHNAV